MKDDFLNKRLSSREQEGLLRKLSPENKLVDLSSNDYLGFARTSYSVEKGASGSGGSRLLTGNSTFAEELEKSIAAFHNAEAGLLFTSGYAANTGLLSSVAIKGDVIIYDELSHASIYDGVRLSKADSFPFRHNDVVHLEERLRFFRENGLHNELFVVVESVYSMDGDLSPLTEVATLCEEYKAKLIVDEAHATGVFGKRGEGKVVELGLEKLVFARVHTFGKALGAHGAIVLGSKGLRDYLINFSRPFIYTTALPEQSLYAISSAYNTLISLYDNILKLNSLIKLFKLKVKENDLHGFLQSSSPIQALIVPGNEAARSLALQLQKEGFDVRPVLSPTVPKGLERIRICLHAFNTETEIERFADTLKKYVSIGALESNKQTV